MYYSSLIETLVSVRDFFYNGKRVMDRKGSAGAAKRSCTVQQLYLTECLKAKG